MTKSSTYLIKGASLLGEREADILIRDGLIAEVGADVSSSEADIIDAKGLIALPGLVDLHTHFAGTRLRRC